MQSKSVEQLDYLYNYLDNLKKSIQQVFDPAFRSGRLSQNLKEILKAQHLILINGVSKKKKSFIYSGYMAGLAGDSQVSAGVLMSE